MYQVVLKENGFVYHNAIKKDGRSIDGKAFCEEMNRTFHNGERIIAYVQRNYIAAVVPVESDERKTYKFTDCWDSSKRRIGEYWVLPGRTSVAAEEWSIDMEGNMILYIKDFSKYVTDEEQHENIKKLINEIENNDNKDSLFELAKILEELNNKNLYELVFWLYKNAADEGMNSDASLCVAKLYKSGKGCCRSIGKSFRYCYDAVSKGNVEAEHFLGLLFKNHNKELALYWLEHAANQNHPQAAVDTAEMYDCDKKLKTANKYYEKASELGVTDASNKTTAWGKFVRTLKYS